MAQQTNENTMDISNIAVYNSQSSDKQTNTQFVTPFQNRIQLSDIKLTSQQQFMLSQHQLYEPQYFYFTPAKFPSPNPNTLCLAPQKENPNSQILQTEQKRRPTQQSDVDTSDAEQFRRKYIGQSYY